MNMKKLSSLLICIFLIISCSKKSTDTQKKELVVAVETEIKVMDPRKALAATDWRTSLLVCQTLVTLNEQFLPVPDLASRFEIKDSGKEYWFHIPKEAQFHDGKNLTVEDVIFSINEYRKEGMWSAGAFKDVVSVEAVEQIVKIKLKAPRANFLTGDLPVIRIMPKNLVQKDEEAYKKNPVGSGPFIYKGKKGRDYLFERFSAYQTYQFKDKVGAVAYPALKLRVIQDQNTRYLSLINGDIDVVFNALPEDKVEAIAKNKSANILSTQGNNYQYLVVNFKNEFLKNLDFRKALSLSINRAEIIKHKLKGRGTEASSLLAPFSYFYKSNQGIGFDLDKAKEHLKKSGFKTPISISVKTSNNKSTVAILNIIKAQWKKIGVELKVDSSEFATYYSQLKKGSFELASGRWVGVSDPDMYRLVLHSDEWAPKGKNRGFFSNSRLDELVDKGRYEVNTEKRKEYYDIVQDIFYAELPYISLWYPDNIVVTSKRVSSFKIHPKGDWTPLIRAQLK